MGEIKWSENQKKIINNRDSNLLVSAAAGSGKTAVLVERIFRRVMDPDNPVDVDKFVIVTFTRAAAAQMKDRLAKRFEKALEEDATNEHLQRQIGLVSTALITTVHSFCGYIIRNYFHVIGLDPSFSQASENEIELIKSEVMNDLLEKEYTDQKEDFINIANQQAYNKSDVKLEAEIYSIFLKAIANPYPMEWFEQMENSYNIETESEWLESEMCATIMKEYEGMLNVFEKRVEELDDLVNDSIGPYYFDEHVFKLGELLSELQSKSTYEERYEKIQSLKWPTARKPAKIDKAELQDEYKDIYDKFKTFIRNTYVKGFFALSVEEQIDQIRQLKAPMLTYLRLAKEFFEKFAAEKRRRNVVDFNDLEQLTLSILWDYDEQTGKRVRSSAALELANQFEEIMIDEYQDSNYVQEEIMRAVSKDGIEGCAPNIFMVGDVKQSIYRFRNACPELFTEKLYSYSMDADSPYRRIDLGQNFRSRREILDGTNSVFKHIMKKDLGGVEYDKSAYLVHGNLGYGQANFDTRIDVCQITGDQLRSDNKPLCEAEVILRKIKEYINPKNPMMVKDDDELRPVKFSDIVILCRSTKTYGGEIADYLMANGVPTVINQTQDFFEALEVKFVTSFLEIIDNPRQDYPLATVLLSPMFDITEDDLAFIRGKDKKVDLYDSLKNYEGNEVICKKIETFLNELNKLREMVESSTVTDLIDEIYKDTNIYTSVSTMENGRQRVANMDYLQSIADEFDSSTFSGLYQFVRYLENIKKQDAKLGEVNLIGESENVVRIMTIHGSKGLEFPVCFIAGMGKQLGKNNAETKLRIHKRVGIADDLYNSEKHTKNPTVLKKVINVINNYEDIGEELRVLYVAMTRPKEKLVMIGCTEDIEEKEMNFFNRSHFASLFEMIIPGVTSDKENFVYECYDGEELLEATNASGGIAHGESSVSVDIDADITYNQDIQSVLEIMDSCEEMDYENLPVKLSVSELKRASLLASDDNADAFASDSIEKPIPSFVEKPEDKMTAAKRGTLWHAVMSAIEFKKYESVDEIKEALGELVDKGLIIGDDLLEINAEKILKYFMSDLGKEMIDAYEKGELVREQPFVISKPCYDIYTDNKSDEPILVQGIIDAFYRTDEGIVLMDYKTDKINAGQEDLLAKRYAVQIECYKEALEKTFGEKVCRCVIYSFALDKSIEM